ncbi:MAG: Asp-tRNA(Asn)/Glu-tRNA(Gln) amidotransferase subunit GatC [Nitrospirae bacterium]|nr:Asp-tRNA(Asn)/Glu-tRNA(Gln) amidotransferase subunit GatC [Nitrospirota bacterium]MBF0536445.1 Asp-tRNA(Asn)/Glu-tRNA(Gln) amidotransferase subunit GatC [Nitrospirota bacterium]MBF0618344.1 Asp-tRNA(Asn)/Glu-tRNA(Gln) amidotransferase subunit GatC [Nitrospirota bacterium]
MRVTTDDVKHIAALSRLKLDASELETLGKQLSDILLYVEKLNELNTDGVEPTSHVIPVMNVFREDIERDSLTIEDALSNAPERAGNFYKVPKIIE